MMFRKRHPRIDDPERLERFLTATRQLSWDAAAAPESLQQLFLALNELAQAEVRYYYNHRKRQGRVSDVCRFLAWAFGTLGLVAPLLGTALGRAAGEFSAWGYVLLALSASAVAANALFGGTASHIRYVSAQLKLEHLIAAFRVDWFKLRFDLTGEPNRENVHLAFSLVGAFIGEMYRVLDDETALWGRTVQEAVEKYARAAQVGGR